MPSPRSECLNYTSGGGREETHDSGHPRGRERERKKRVHASVKAVVTHFVVEQIRGAGGK